MRLPTRLLAAVAVFVSQGALGRPCLSQPAQAHGKPARNFPKGAWQVVRDIGLDNDLFDIPDMIAVDSTRAVVFDRGTFTVKSIRLDGTVEWKSGRKGAGPGEYIGPIGLRLDDAGRTIVLDEDAARVTILDRRGKLVATIPLPTHYAAVLPGSTSTRFLLVDSGKDAFITLADTTPRLEPAMSIPPEFRDYLSISRGFGGAVSTAQGHLIAFTWTSRMLLVDRGGRLVRSCMGVDSLTLPPVRKMKFSIDSNQFLATKVDTAARRAVTSLTSLGGLTVVKRPAAPDSLTTIDLYVPACGRYLETRRLPVHASEIAGNASVLVAVVMDPVPHLEVLRWQP